jgi:centrosomal protein CEP135
MDEGYGEVVSFESMPLVDRLLDDLISLRQTHNTLSARFNELSANEAKLQRSVHPTQKELARMVKENNQLHLELIEHCEQTEARDRRTTLEVKKLKNEIGDQKFVIAQQSQHIRDLERKIEAHKARITDLLNANFTCTVGPYGDSKPKGQQIMLTQIASPSVQAPTIDMGDQVCVNLEDITTKQLERLNAELQLSKEVEADLRSTIEMLQGSVRNREAEIHRMGKLLAVNVNSDLEDLEHARAEQEVVIKRLNDQLDIVSGQLALVRFFSR